MMQRPEIKELSNIQIFKPQSTTLDNGIDMKSISIGDQPVSRLDIIFEGGRCDGRNQTVSEMLSAILREGTTSLNAQEIAEALDYHGAWLGCDASSHNATLSLYSLNRNFEKVVPILADIVMNPSFPEQELSNLKSLAANRLRINRQKVAFLAMETFARLHFGEAPTSERLSQKMTSKASRLKSYLNSTSNGLPRKTCLSSCPGKWKGKCLTWSTTASAKRPSQAPHSKAQPTARQSNSNPTPLSSTNPTLCSLP